MKASGVVMTNFSFEGARSTYVDAVFFPTGSDAYLKTLESGPMAGRLVHYVREAFGHFKPIAACGVAVPWIAHKCLPGCTDMKADLSAEFSSKNGLVLGQNVVDKDASAWKKVSRDASKPRFIALVAI